MMLQKAHRFLLSMANTTTRGWTEWTQGFQYGSAILQYDATGEKSFLDIGENENR